MDVYVDKQGRTWLVDFNVFGHDTDPLLYTWGEVLKLEEEALAATDANTTGVATEFRVVENEKAVLSSQLRIHRVPADLVSIPGDVAKILQQSTI